MPTIEVVLTLTFDNDAYAHEYGVDSDEVPADILKHVPPFFTERAENLPVVPLTTTMTARILPTPRFVVTDTHGNT